MNETLKQVENMMKEKRIIFIPLSDFIKMYKEYYNIMLRFKCDRAVALQRYFVEDAIRDDVHHEAKTYILFDESERLIIAYFTIRTACIMRDAVETVDIGQIVRNIVPCIEITKFCVNECYEDILVSTGRSGKGLGTYVYIQFIMPLLVVLSDIVGFSEVILFAIRDEAGKVINAYRNHMGFETLDDDSLKVVSALENVAIIVEEYVSECQFMFQDIEEILRKYKGGNYHGN